MCANYFQVGHKTINKNITFIKHDYELILSARFPLSGVLSENLSTVMAIVLIKENILTVKIFLTINTIIYQLW